MKRTYRADQYRPTEFKTFEEAKSMRDSMNSHQVHGVSPWLSNIVIAGPNEGFCVVQLGWAHREGFTEVRGV